MNKKTKREREEKANQKKSFLPDAAAQSLKQTAYPERMPEGQETGKQVWRTEEKTVQTQTTPHTKPNGTETVHKLEGQEQEENETMNPQQEENLETVDSLEEVFTEPVIGETQVRQAQLLLEKYRQGKTNLDRRIVENDQWWRLRHWDVVGRTAAGDLEPASAWLFNSVANKHGDAMDNAPEPVVLPRESGDTQDAQTLSQILPVIAEHNDFEGVYSDAMWDKCKSGTAAYCVTWDAEAENGLGDISIRRASVLNLFWEPGVCSIQDSRNLFYTSMMENEVLRRKYPELEDAAPPVQGARYVHDDQIDTRDKSMVVDWYYKQRDAMGRQVVHYCKFVGETVLYASENDPLYRESGYYAHGKYPFVIDRLYPIEDSPAGFGYIDIMQSPQLYIDKLDAVVLKNAMLAGRPRWFIRDSCAVNQEEFADWSKDFVHVAGRLEDGDIKQIQVDTLPAYLVNHMHTKINELKETSGNRDFAQGGTSAGVTAAAAITALQEAGNKLSRDMLKGSYRAYRKIMELCIELIRQFYSAEREFRITGQDGKMQFVQYSNAGLQDQPLPPAYPEQVYEPDYNPAVRRPIFDVIVKAQKSNPYSQFSQNETAKELYQLGVFQPQNAEQALALLGMMQFEGKRQAEEAVRQNATMHDQLRQMQEVVHKMAALLQRQGAGLPQSPENLPPPMEGVPASGQVSMETIGTGMEGEAW